MTATVTTPLSTSRRTWRRFTPAQRTGRFAIYLLLVIAIVTSLRTIEVIPEFLYDAPDQVVDLLTRMWPIAWTYYPRGVQTTDGRIFVFGHVGGDDAYGAVDQSVVADSFRLEKK